MPTHVTTDLSSGWYILQDVHDVGEQVGLPTAASNTTLGSQVSEWEPLEHLEHLQVALAANPYWGRDLRYFNQAPWWYRRSFTVDGGDAASVTVLRFSNVDYACRVWLNGTLLGDHEGYSTPFEFDVTSMLQADENRLVVKVWSPWDDTVRADEVDQRTYQVERRMVKGTYEHDDTLIARDVNPVGIYGTVQLVTAPRVLDVHGLLIDYRLHDQDAIVTVRAGVHGVPPSEPPTIRIREATGRVVAEATARGDGGVLVAEDIVVHGVRRWETWDRGTPWLYEVEADLGQGVTATATVGFRDVSMERTADRTVLQLNGRRLYVRGTSYFPDVYLSRMHASRYRRDLQAIKDAGFNLIRVHVHVELPQFYDLCDEYGIAVMQDSEYNWTHPEAAEFGDRLSRIYLETMRLLHNHPSVVTWICLNEPGQHDVDGGTHGFAMTKIPGPALLEAVSAADPSRPLILGSYCADDPNSGDSHNYIGSLYGPAAHYTEIDGSKEKLNTEFGIDAPGVEQNLRPLPAILDRLHSDPGVIERAQEYQYRLTKYYIEHYRRQRFDPCSGYCQFMFIDLSPQSWYGVLDYWGQLKPVWRALLESNQPVAVMLEQTARSATGIRIVNDTPFPLGDVTVEWSVIRSTGDTTSGASRVDLDADAHLTVAFPSLSAEVDGSGLEVRLSVCHADGRQLATNRYEGLFDHPSRIPGHPGRMSHELGMRLFGATTAV